ncbi:alpha-ketoacid dehydrogenase subunit beta [Enterococcus sp. BWM-S5]|uniref:Alpha-ketoacid dehydrogenase subunit beta n=1 Tax=Enterococcus larvae TaxID=2794352 RepID=A0ABS4CEV6_9ENTE|nr:transketolase C-terminal domain-containing protein [Enterococcus larvae]MBP1044787.1 alpha-ketoacid dehydrogenase subunit beta [Enterococcus larvae]
MVELKENRELGPELRSCVVSAIEELMAENETVVALEADLGAASGWNRLASADPQRFINVGIAEANMIGVAAGLNLAGYTPFVHTFGPFATRRVFDQLFLSGGYSKNTINIYGSDPGFTVGHNGGTHTTWEDVALLRMIPEAVVCDAADAVQMKWIIKEFSKHKGIHYVRGNRKSVQNIYVEGTDFQLGKGNVLAEGEDILIIAAGQLVSEALTVSKELSKQGIRCEVIDMFTIKPLDRQLIMDEVRGKKRVVTIENHSITGGLGSAVAEVLAEENLAVPLLRIGVDEQFGQVGTPEYLQEVYGLTAEQIKNKVIESMK